MATFRVHRHAIGRLVCVVACSMVCGGAFAQVRASGPPPAPAAGTGVIAGVITGSDTGRPLRRTRVMGGAMAVTLTEGERKEQSLRVVR